MAAPRIVFSPAKLAQARRRFEAGEPIEKVAAYLGCTRNTLLKRAADLGWVRAPRRPRIEHPDGASPNAEAIAAEVESAVERELESIAKILKRLDGPDRSAQAERTARTLASLSRTLGALKRVRAAAPEAGQGDDDEVPRDLDEFRRALAQRIDAFVAGRVDAAVPDDGEPTDG